MVHSTDLEFRYSSPTVAETIYRSVQQEAGAIPGDRTRGRVRQDGTTLAVSITADDLSALRAGVHTWCSLVATAEATVHATG
ncbi:MAG: KEOPS complex subunit Pcc1 [Halobacteriaceae archaeon]